MQMNKKALKWIVLMLLLVGVEGKELFLESVKGKVKLYGVDSSNAKAVFGVYSLTLIDIGGASIHLFPNRKYVVVEESEFGESNLLSEGEFIIEKSVVLFVESKGVKIDKKYAYKGVKENKQYVQGFGVFLFDSMQLAKLKKNPNSFDYWYQTQAYIEWRKEYDLLIKKQTIK